MEKVYLKKVSLISLLGLIVIVSGCCINIGSCSMRANYQRTVQLSALLSPGSSFEAHTYNGSIEIAGAEITDCNLTATITAWAVTKEEAQELAERTTVRLEPFGNRLIVKIDKPQFLMNKSVNVSLDVQIPNKSDLVLSSHNGSLVIKDITGEINSTTHNGKITAERISGTTELHTHNGSVNCREISGDARIKTHNGTVRIYYSKTGPSICDISLVTYNGGIELETPSGFSGEVDISTHNGSMRTDLPITIVGEVSKRKLSGTIGSGQGKLHLETHNGSISVR